jgi:Mrp family chromosome partitioning ATPase
MLPQVKLDSARLEREKIISHAATHPGHVAFNVLRTKISQTLVTNSWRTVAVTSPKPGCGKTMISLNLAFSLARQKNCRTVLIDLDLRRSSVARAIGYMPEHSIGEYLEGHCALADCLVGVSDTLYFGLNNSRANRIFEVAQHENASRLVEDVISLLDPQVILIDLPPILSNDDVITFAPFVDCGFLVAASGKTTAREIEKCEAEFASAAEFLGVVLNKCTDLSEDHYNYSGA